MAKFKIGDRVRKIAYYGNPVTPNVRIGTEGTIRDRAITKEGDWRIEWDGVGAKTADGSFLVAFEWQLAPLTDPKADEERWARDKVREITRPQPVLLQGDLETRVPHPLAEGVPCWPSHE